MSTIFLTWGYAVYGSAFIKVPNQYQWILALLNPYVRDFFSKFISHVAKQSAGDDNKTTQILTAHYVTTKHAIFLGAIISGVATPESSVCILLTDLSKALYSGWKIIKKSKLGANIEGKERIF